jgi:hypothetical protein
LFHNSKVFGSRVIHILYIYSTNIGTEYFKRGIYSPYYSLENAVCFIILKYLVPVLFTFYIQGVLKLKKKKSGAKRLNMKQGRSVIWHRWQSGHSMTRVDTHREEDTTPNHPQADTRKKNVDGQHQVPTLLPPGKRHDAHCKGNWMGSLERTEHFAPNGIRSLDCPARNEFLYRVTSFYTA